MDAKHLKAWRKSLELSQKEAAEALGLKRRIFQYYEKGERDGETVKPPKTVRLACWALTQGVIDYEGPEIVEDKKKPEKADKPKKPEKAEKAKKPEKKPAAVVVPPVAVPVAAKDAPVAPTAAALKPAPRPLAIKPAPVAKPAPAKPVAKPAAKAAAKPAAKPMAVKPATAKPKAP